MNYSAFVLRRILVCTVPFFSLIACNTKERRFSSEYDADVYFAGDALPVAEAISAGNGAELERLIKAGKTDLNQPGKGGYTYLLYATEILRYDMVKILLNNGADPNVISPCTYTPGAGEQPEPTGRSCVEIACYSKYHIKYLKLFVEYGADVNQKCFVAPLTRAIDGDQRDKIDFLLKHGADVNIVAKCGLPPLISAAVIWRWHLVEKFLDHGADPFLEDKGCCLQKYIQDYINRMTGTPEGRKRVSALIIRLQKQGMEFDLSNTKMKLNL